VEGWPRLRLDMNAWDGNRTDRGQGVSKMPHSVACSVAIADEHDERHHHERRAEEEKRSVTSHC
jgi:hypothetical protein